MNDLKSILQNADSNLVIIFIFLVFISVFSMGKKESYGRIIFSF